MIRSLQSTPAFVRAAKRLAGKRAPASQSLQQALLRLQENAFDPRLRTHKLTGALAGRWSCSAAYDLRIIFRFVRQDEEESILLLSVGTHDEVY